MIVKLTGEFRQQMNRSTVEVYGQTTIKGLINALNGCYPTVNFSNCNVAINGTMYTDYWLQPIKEDDEIVIMPPIEGG